MIYFKARPFAIDEDRWYQLPDKYHGTYHILLGDNGLWLGAISWLTQPPFSPSLVSKGVVSLANIQVSARDLGAAIATPVDPQLIASVSQQFSGALKHFASNLEVEHLDPSAIGEQAFALLLRALDIEAEAIKNDL
jgi:hypothetical protein